MVRLRRDETVLLVIDVQERLLPVMHERDDLVARTLVAIEGVRVLGIPVIVTEQYPKGLGRTVAAVLAAVGTTAVHEKITFSVLGDSVRAELERLRRPTVLVVGIEAHVCVLQSCLDLIDAGFTPVLVSDCTSSRHAHDRDAAVARIAKAGVVVSTVESALFELLGSAGTDEFKAISRLIREL